MLFMHRSHHDLHTCVCRQAFPNLLWVDEAQTLHNEKSRTNFNEGWDDVSIWRYTVITEVQILYR